MKSLIMLAFLTTLASGTVMSSEVPELKCFGTEPFWDITIDSKGFLKMSDPVNNEGQFYSKTTLKNALGTSADFAFQIEARNMKNKTLKLNVVRQACNDGMSDEVYPYTTLVDVDGTIYFGCCNK